MEYLFRGKDRKKNVFVEGHYYYDLNGGATIVVTKHDSGDGRTEPPSDYQEHIAVHPDTVGMWTGLTDKNGKKIFEGDVVQYDNGTKAKVVFHNGGFCAYDGYASSSEEAYTLLSPIHETPFGNDFELEKIGSIHDNPELLEL